MHMNKGDLQYSICPGFVHHEPKKIPGLFQDFQGPFSQFSRTKIHKTTADFHSNDMPITTLKSVAQGK